MKDSPPGTHVLYLFIYLFIFIIFLNNLNYNGLGYNHITGKEIPYILWQKQSSGAFLLKECCLDTGKVQDVAEEAFHQLTSDLIKCPSPQCSFLLNAGSWLASLASQCVIPSLLGQALPDQLIWKQNKSLFPSHCYTLTANYSSFEHLLKTDGWYLLVYYPCPWFCQ